MAFLSGIFGSPKIRQPTEEGEVPDENREEDTQTEDTANRDEPETNETRSQETGAVPKPVPTPRKRHPSSASTDSSIPDEADENYIHTGEFNNAEDLAKVAKRYKTLVSKGITFINKIESKTKSSEELQSILDTFNEQTRTMEDLWKKQIETSIWDQRRLNDEKQKFRDKLITVNKARHRITHLIGSSRLNETLGTSECLTCGKSHTGKCRKTTPQKTSTRGTQMRSTEKEKTKSPRPAQNLEKEKLNFAGLPSNTLEDLQELIKENNASIDSLYTEIDRINVLGKAYSSQNKTELNVLLQEALSKQIQFNKEYNQLERIQKSRIERQQRMNQRSQDVRYDLEHGRTNKRDFREQHRGSDYIPPFSTPTQNERPRPFQTRNDNRQFDNPPNTKQSQRQTETQAWPIKPKLGLEAAGKSTNADRYYPVPSESSGRALTPTTDSNSQALPQPNPQDLQERNNRHSGEGFRFGAGENNEGTSSFQRRNVDSIQQRERINYQSMPKIDIEAFNGDKNKYVLFKNKFQASIGHWSTMPSEEKSIRLLNLLSGKPYNLVEGLCGGQINDYTYQEMWNTLESRYGGEIRLRNNPIEKLKSFEQLKDMKHSSLEKLLDLLLELKSHYHVHEPQQLANETSILQNLAKSLLPNAGFRQYLEWIEDTEQPDNFQKLVMWLEKKYKSAQYAYEAMGKQQVSRPRKENTYFTQEEEQNSDFDEEDDTCQEQENWPHRTLATNQGPIRKDIATTLAPARKESTTKSKFPEAKQCIKCKGDHRLFICPIFKKMKAEERTKFALTMRLCYHCLSRGHRFKDCRIAKDRKCDIDNCTQSHHPLLHKPRGATFFSIDEYPEDDENTPEEQQTLISQQAFVNLTSLETIPIPVPTPPKVMSKTIFKIDRSARVYNTIFSGVVYLCKGKFKKPVSIAYDGCSNNTNISAKLAEEMGLEVLTNVKDRVIDVLGGQSNVKSKLVKLELQPLDSNKAFEISGYTVTNFLERVHVPDWADHLEKFEHLKQFKIPRLKHNKVDILLGTDFHKLLLANAKVSGGDEEPSAQLTELGWMFGGPLANYNLKESANLAASEWVTHLSQERNLYTENELSLHDLVQRSWDIDALGLTEKLPGVTNKLEDKQPWTQQEIEIDAKMKCTYLKKEQAYQISVPWKNIPPDFVSNRTAVKLRQDKTEQNLKKRGVQIDQVEEIFKGYEEKGYIRQLTPKETTEKKAWYEPWFLVIDPLRDTSKIRPVFDAAARYNNVSLNSNVEKTPNRLLNIHDILLRFRQHKFCMSADVSEMFLRIKLHPDDRKYHRFTCNGRDWEWQSVMFGNRSSPDASQKVLFQNCEDHGKAYPEAVQTILNATLMDDTVDSREKEDQIISLVQELPKLMSMANMKIGKIYCNSKKAMESVPKDLWAKQVVFDDKESIVYSDNKVLGVAYSGNESDSLHYVSKFKSMTEWTNKKTITKVKFWTKRLVLQAAMSIYDPLGNITPFTVQARVLMQRIWRLKIGWDDKLDQDIVDHWEKWTSQVMELTEIRIPRWVGFLSNAKTTLHTFSDASTDVYAAVVYLRTDTEKEVNVRLVTAKARVTPLKAETISRCELMGCVTGVRLCQAVNKIYKLKTENCHYWTDSQVCLHWITTPAKAFKAYVANRSGEIQNYTHQDQWHHVPTKENPADIATRPISVKDLTNSELWWKGPDFLKKPSVDWPETKLLRKAEDKLELKTNEVTFCSNSWQRPDPTRPPDVALQAEMQDNTDRFERLKPENWSMSKIFDGYRNCVKRWAYILKCWNRWAHKTPFTTLTSNDMENARKFLIKQSQQESYPELIQAGKLTTKMPTQLKSHNVFLDENGILRSHSRLAKITHLTYDQRYPVVLHRKSGLAKLLVKYYHINFGHPVGHQALINKITEEYSISGLGVLCHQVKSDCYLCKLEKNKAKTQLMADLPNFRFEQRSKPFLNTGLDYAGPFSIKIGRGKTRKKVWILVLTCLTIRAVHLEISYGQDTSYFLNALSRFCDARGVPEQVISDNQRAFIRADKELQEWYKSIDFNKLEEATGYGYKGSKGIKWNFNPPYAPHYGGVFETIVKSMKRALNSTLGNSDANEDEFRTSVCSVTNLLNMRPITKYGEDNDDIVLTPNHFLMGQMSGMIFPPNSEEKLDLRQRYKFVINLVDVFWARFLKEMAAKMQPRQKWSQQQPDLTVDSSVLEIDPNLPRGQWRLLRVVEILPSADGLVRRVVVSNSKGKIYERAVNRLVPIVVN